MRKIQRKVSRRTKGGNQRRATVAVLQKAQAKIKNQRRDFHHKVSRSLVETYDVIAIEKLNILGLSKGILSKQVHTAAWENFFLTLKSKAANAGKTVIEVNPHGTSQTCICGETVRKNLSVRRHECKVCGLSEHRDSVAAKVILKRALGQSVEAITKAVGL